MSRPFDTEFGPPGHTNKDLGIPESVKDAREAGELTRAKILEDLKNRHVRLQDELDDLVKLLAFAKEALQHELVQGYGYQKKTLMEGDLRKLRDLSTIMSNVVGTKIKYDQAAKSLADVMTPKEERAAVLAYLKVMDRKDLGDLFRTLNEYLTKAGIVPLRVAAE